VESEPKFRAALEGSTVEYRALGILSAEDVGRVLSKSDVSLFVRGCISTQRGSAIASIACGVPLVTYAGAELAAPLSEAGVVAVPFGDRERLAEATVKVLINRTLWLELHQRSQGPYQKYFCWGAVASRFVKVFDNA
jgi:glycosyltransferase involved in cell wall biosynthesis